jgi:hypothetical protein
LVGVLSPVKNQKVMKKMHISIENPCHEDWQTMTPETQGRFCGACEKTVVDFTTMSDAEILQYFSKPSVEKTCGRFRVEQLSESGTSKQNISSERNWVPATSSKPSKALLHFAYLLVIVMGVGLSSCNNHVQGEILGDTTMVGATVLDTSAIDSSSEFNNSKTGEVETGEVDVYPQQVKPIESIPETQDGPKTRPHVIELMGLPVAYPEPDTNRKTKPVDPREYMTGPYEVPLKPEHAVNPKYIKGKVKLPPHRMGKPAIVEEVKPVEEPKIMGECVMPYEEKNQRD